MPKITTCRLTACYGFCPSKSADGDRHATDSHEYAANSDEQPASSNEHPANRDEAGPKLRVPVQGSAGFFGARFVRLARNSPPAKPFAFRTALNAARRKTRLRWFFNAAKE